MPNFNLIGSGVSEPQVAENRYLPLTGGIALNVLHCDVAVNPYKPFAVRYARKHGHLVLQNVTLPRIGAIETMLHELSPLSPVAVNNGL